MSNEHVQRAARSEDMGDIDYRARVNTALQEAEDLVSTYGAATAYQHLAAALRRLLETWPASGAR